MKIWISRVLSVFAITALLTFSALSPPAMSATPEEIEAAIINGLSWLADQQNADGSWPAPPNRPDEEVAATGLAVLAFEMQAIELGLDPMNVEYEYGENVGKGLAYILSNKHEQPISAELAGDPDGDGDGKGVYFVNYGKNVIYNTGIAMMAIAASGHPELYGDTLQDAVDYLAWGQAEDGSYRGGWSYAGNQPSSDNSNSGYATSGLGFAAAAPPYGFGLTIPQFVKDELSPWIDVMQDDVNGDLNDGGSWYMWFWQWVNILKTGNLLYEMALVGDTVETQRVKDAIDYIERHWNDPGGDSIYSTGWRDHCQATFTMMKGLEALGIDLIDLDDDGVAEHDWFEEVSNHLVSTQNGDGSWPNDPWERVGEPILSTAWALLALQKAVPREPANEIAVFVDIKPSSCPNSLNPKSKGVLPVAVLGAGDFDVTMVDPATIQLSLEGFENVSVEPLRWSYEDVATPFDGELCDCHEFEGDGYLDLTLKFDTSELVQTLNLNKVAGETISLLLTGKLKEEYGGSPIEGQDCVRVLRQGKKK